MENKNLKFERLNPSSSYYIATDILQRKQALFYYRKKITPFVEKIEKTKSKNILKLITKQKVKYVDLPLHRISEKPIFYYVSDDWGHSCIYCANAEKGSFERISSFYTRCYRDRIIKDFLFNKINHIIFRLTNTKDNIEYIIVNRNGTEVFKTTKEEEIINKFREIENYEEEYL